MAAADKELRRCTVQIAVALFEGAARKGHIVGDIDFDAAEVVHHLHQSLHIHRHVVIDGQLILVVDDLRQGGNAAAVGEGHGVYLVVATRLLRGICSIRSAPPLMSNWQ